MASEDKAVRPLSLGFGRTYRARRGFGGAEGPCCRNRRRLLRCPQPAPGRTSRRPLAGLHLYVEIALSEQSSAADGFGCVRTQSTGTINLPAEPVYLCFGSTREASKPLQSGRAGVDLNVSAWYNVLRSHIVEPISIVQDYIGALSSASGRIVVLFGCELSELHPVWYVRGACSFMLRGPSQWT